ncbi:MAG: RluA family pseudouridine synthase [Cyanobacteria bacterium NC_groundwater_1444_Ag_S-0.65um_54_12]|nr:RluA family pseudouridine synthase [Cyanobacteria bacterium NC_groundwater_1444_Ag_S-0.65um_54_12]
MKAAEQFTLIVPAEAFGKRLDHYLCYLKPELSRTRLQQLLAEGFIRVDGNLAKASQRLRSGECLAVKIPPLALTTLQPEVLPLTLLHEDEHIAVVNKPQGMVTHPAPGNRAGTLVNALLAQIKALSSAGGNLRPGIVHRLDKDTSGLLVVAKSDIAYWSLVKQLKARSISRRYLALAQGRFKIPEGIIEAPIGRHPKDRTRMAVIAAGRSAKTSYRVLEEFSDVTYLELALETGRTHQIRVHLAYLHHPVLGDPVYGGNRPAMFQLPGQALHAWRLAFLHPITGKELVFESQPPLIFQQTLERLRQCG